MAGTTKTAAACRTAAARSTYCRRGLLPTLLNPRRVAQIWGAKAVKRLEDEL